MRYEAFWDGLLYRLTRGSPTWMRITSGSRPGATDALSFAGN
jgi:hypothetical protein